MLRIRKPDRPFGFSILHTFWGNCTLVMQYGRTFHIVSAISMAVVVRLFVDADE